MPDLIIEIDAGEDGGYRVALRGVAGLLAEAVLPGAIALPGGLTLTDAQTALADRADDSGRWKAVGLALYGLLASTAVGAAWSDALRAPAVRTYFDVRPPELRALPWELMSTPQIRRPFLDPRRPCLRGVPGTPAEAVTDVPVRVLVVVGEPHDPDLRGADEVDAICRALHERPGEWQVDVLRGPDREDFFTTCNEILPHVLHFVGHSTQLHGKPGLLVQPDAGGEAWALDTEAIINRIDEAPRLVVLNACRSAAVDLAEAQTNVRSVADAFAELGSVAQVAMQGDVDSASAVVFAGEVYDRIAGGAPLDVAVAHGRRRLLSVSPRVSALPSLTVSTEPAAVLPKGTEVGDQERRKLLRERYCEVALAVDRSKERRLLFGGVASTAPRSGMLVAGPTQVGKTTVLQTCMYTWHLRGLHAAYVDLRALNNGGRVDWLTLVRGIRARVTANRPDLEAAAALFDHRLAHHRRGHPAPVVPSGEPLEADDGGPWRADNEHEEELRCGVLVALRQLLSDAATGRPLVLALDHVDRLIPAEVGHSLAPFLLKPAATGNIDGVRLIVADTPDALQVLPGDLRDALVPVPIGPLAVDDVVPVYRELIARLGVPMDADVQSIGELFGRKGVNGFPQLRSITGALAVGL